MNKKNNWFKRQFEFKNYQVIIIGIIIITFGFIKTDCSNYNEEDYNFQFDEKAYLQGLAIGCDIGCIDYDLRQHNVSWNGSEEDYSVLNSTEYRKCSAFCLDSYSTD